MAHRGWGEGETQLRHDGRVEGCVGISIISPAANSVRDAAASQTLSVIPPHIF